MKRFMSCLSAVVMFFSLILIVISLFLFVSCTKTEKVMPWNEIASPSARFDSSENNTITMYLNVDSDMFRDFNNLTKSDKIKYIVYWGKVPSDIVHRTGITSLGGYQTVKMDKNDRNGRIIFTYYGGVKITVQIRGVRGNKYVPGLG